MQISLIVIIVITVNIIVITIVVVVVVVGVVVSVVAIATAVAVVAWLILLLSNAIDIVDLVVGRRFSTQLPAAVAVAVLHLLFLLESRT